MYACRYRNPGPLLALLVLLAWPAYDGASPLDARAVREAGVVAEAQLEPGKGVLLIARRLMPDPHFRRTVVLIVQHDENGTLGLIINRPTDYTVADVLPELEGLKSSNPTLHFGGPVGISSMMFLLRAEQAPEASVHVLDDLYLAGDLELLEDTLAGEGTGARARVFIGHAGWLPGQLKGEITRGDWHLYPGDIHTVLEQPAKSIWPELIELQDPSGHMAAWDGPRP